MFGAFVSHASLKSPLPGAFAVSNSSFVPSTLVCRRPVNFQSGARQDRRSRLQHHVLTLCSSLSTTPQPDPVSAAAGNGASVPSNTAAPIKQSSLSVVREILDGAYHLALPLWNGDRKLIANLWTAAAVLLAFMATAYAVMLSMLQRFFWNCLAAKDVTKFSKLLVLYLVAVTVGPVIIGLFTWVKERLSLSCGAKHSPTIY